MNDNVNSGVGNDTVTILVRNAVKCLSCNTVLESKYRHDFQCCMCSNQTSVDGGTEYSRISGKDLDLIENLCEYKEYTKFEYDKIQQEHKEQQRILNERGVAEGKLVKLFGEYYDIKVIDLLLRKGILDKDLYNQEKEKSKRFLTQHRLIKYLC